MVQAVAPAYWAKDPLLAAQAFPFLIASFNFVVAGFVPLKLHVFAYSVSSNFLVQWLSGFSGFWVSSPVPNTFTECCVQSTVALSHPSHCGTCSTISLSLWNIRPLVCLGGYLNVECPGCSIPVVESWDFLDNVPALLWLIGSTPFT